MDPNHFIEGGLKYNLGVLCLSLVVFYFINTASLFNHAPATRSATFSRDDGFEEACVGKTEIGDAITILSEGSQSDTKKASEFLLNASRKSLNCRSRVIGAIVEAMDKPSLDFKRSQTDYYLWRYAAPLLGQMQASQGIDLLISHIDSTDGSWSSTMVQQPALYGLIKMGPLAIPKLTRALKDSSDTNIKRDVVFCIASIGGKTARNSLEEALPSQTDACVANFIRVSIENLNNPQQRIRDRPKWFSAFLCK